MEYKATHVNTEDKSVNMRHVLEGQTFILRTSVTPIIFKKLYNNGSAWQFLNYSDNRIYSTADLGWPHNQNIFVYLVNIKSMDIVYEITDIDNWER